MPSEETATFAISLMLCIAVATVFSEILPLDRSYWVPLAVAVVMKPDFGPIPLRAVQYGAGTVVGACFAMLILLAEPSPSALVVPIVVMAALIPYALSHNYALFGAAFTPLIVLILDIVGRSGWRIGENRLVDVLVGCGIVLVVESLAQLRVLAMGAPADRGLSRAAFAGSQTEKRGLATELKQ